MIIKWRVEEDNRTKKIEMKEGGKVDEARN